MASFLEEPFPDDAYGLEALNTIQKYGNNVFLVIGRKKNGNVMVYEIRRNQQNGDFTHIDFYWLDLDPSYRAKARGKGKTHDRDEVSKLEKIYYGMSIVRKMNSQKWEVKFDQYPQKMILIINSKGKPTLYRKSSSNDIQEVTSMFVQDRCVLNSLPVVDAVFLIGYDAKTKEPQTFKVR